MIALCAMLLYPKVSDYILIAPTKTMRLLGFCDYDVALLIGEHFEVWDVGGAGIHY